MISFSPNRLARRSAALQRGLSLIELMISITIGLIILVALTTTFVNQSRSRAELEKTSRLIDNGRYALEVMAENLTIAGFYGELNPTTIAVPNPTDTVPPNPCSVVAATIATALPLHIQGYNNATALPSTCLVGGVVPTIVDGTDILVIRRTETNAVAVGTLLGGAIAPHLQVSLCRYDALTHTLQTAASSFPLFARNCTRASGSTVTSGGIAAVRRLFVHIYFISPCNILAGGAGVCTAAADNGKPIPTLKRLEINTAGAFTITPLVEGVENMQIDYGLDGIAPFNGTVDAWVDCSGVSCTNAQWANVVAVRIHLLAKSLEGTKGYTDAKTYALGLNGTVGPFDGEFKRRVYSQFIRLTNPAGRREGAI